MKKYSIRKINYSEISDALEKEIKVVLTPNCSKIIYETAKDWYDNFGYHETCSQHGSWIHPIIPYERAKNEKDTKINSKTSCEECKTIFNNLVKAAKEIAEHAAEIESLLEETIEHYMNEDIDGVLDALNRAYHAEIEYGGAAPATEELAKQILCVLEEIE